MSCKVGLDLICLQISYLPTHHQKSSVNSMKGGQQTLSILSLLALIDNRLSALHASRYTTPTWPWSVVTKMPIRPSHTLSQAVDAAHWPSGEKAMWETWRWWPVSRVMGFGGGAVQVQIQCHKISQFAFCEIIIDAIKVGSRQMVKLRLDPI